MSSWLEEKPDKVGAFFFTAAQVLALQQGISVMPTEVDRLICGAACALVACRIRHLDLQRVVAEPTIDAAPQDHGYVEINLTKVKSQANPGTATLRKIAAGHATALDGPSWAAAWLEERRRSGRNAAVDRTILPAYSAGKGWLKRRTMGG